MSKETIPVKETRIELGPGIHVHLVGIGGFGLSAIARVLLGRGYKVSGSDLQSNELTQELARAGATIYRGHEADYGAEADALLVSSAVPADNIEIVAARARGIPIFKRAEFLGALMTGEFGIAVAGSHGKTTTTGMIAQILLEADYDPSVIVGGVLPLLGSNGRAGQSEYFVVEADEYDYMFLGLRPRMAVLTNIEYDHPDFFPSEEDYQQAFIDFIGKIPSGGRLVVNADDPVSVEIINALELEGVTIEKYGLQESGANWRAVELRQNQLGGTDFLVQNESDYAGLARLRVPGEHNVYNALAATVVGVSLGIDFSIIRRALAAFGGIGRRFQVVGEVGDVTIIDDYAHHPTEIRATLAAARQRYPGRRLWAVWQPHTFSRTKRLIKDFATSFYDADQVILLDIFRSRETDDLGINPNIILQSLKHTRAQHLSGVKSATGYILDRIRPGDVVITLTAGDGNLVGQQVLEGLRRRLVNINDTSNNLQSSASTNNMQGH